MPHAYAVNQVVGQHVLVVPLQQLRHQWRGGIVALRDAIKRMALRASKHRHVAPCHDQRRIEPLRRLRRMSRSASAAGRQKQDRKQ